MGLTKSAIGLLAAGVILLAGCDTNLRGDAPPPSPASEAEAAPIPLPPPASGPTMSDEPVRADGRHEMYSVSSDVAVGQPYIFELDGRCGLGHRVDFAGRLWDAVDKPQELRGKKTTGTMTLVNDQLAEFETADGLRVRFIRHLGKKLAEPCD